MKKNLYLCRANKNVEAMRLIELNLQHIFELCKKYKVKSLSVFGSILTNRFNADSDVDLLVNFKDDEIDLLDFADNFFDLQYSLEKVFNRKVDLVCEDSLQNPIFIAEVNRTKQLIYG